MDITESFRPEDLSKTDFFDFVTAPDLGITTSGGGGADSCSSGGGVGNNSEQPLQGYDQVYIIYIERINNFAFLLK